MKTVLITGCAGFIGSFTTKYFLEKGFAVIGVDDLNDYYDVRLKRRRMDMFKNHKSFTFVKCDIADLSKLKCIFKKNAIGGIVHLAARAGVRYSMENPHIYFQTNVTGTLNLLELAREFNVKKITMASTSSLYAGQQMPFSESLAVNTPISPYAASKKSAEALTYTYHYLYGLDISIVRFFTVYGPLGRPDMVCYRFIKQINEGEPIQLFGDGKQSRDFTYIDDIVRGVYKASKLKGYQTINLGNDNPHELNDMLHLIEKYLGKKANIDHQPFHIADIKATWADISQARKLLKWEPKVGLDKGVKSCVQWYLDNRSWAKNIELAG